MTKDEVINTQDGQALADAVAVEVMGWHKVIKPPTWHNFYERDYWTSDDGKTGEYVDDYEPHLPTEKGKSQCWDLMVKCGLIAMPYEDDEWGAAKDTGRNVSIEITDKDPQIAVLKAALLSVRGE